MPEAAEIARFFDAGPPGYRGIAALSPETVAHRNGFATVPQLIRSLQRESPERAYLEALLAWDAATDVTVWRPWFFRRLRAAVDDAGGLPVLETTAAIS